MEFLREGKVVNSRALQVHRKRLHFAPRVRKVGVTDPGRHYAAPFDSDFESAESFSSIAQGIVSTVQAVEPGRVVLFVEALRTDQQLEISERALDIESLLIR